LNNTTQKQLYIHRNIDIDFTKLTSIFTSSSNLLLLAKFLLLLFIL